MHQTVKMLENEHSRASETLSTYKQLIPAAACLSMRGKPLLQGHFVFLQFCLSTLAPSRFSLQEETALLT
jgi:hypothetical protein